jgi:DNA replication protein DnaC
MEAISNITERIKRLSNSHPNFTQSAAHDCEICKDTEWIINTETNSATPCKCQESKHYKRILENCGISEVFLKKTFHNYIPKNQTQREAKDMAQEYVKNFQQIRNERNNSIAFLKQVGCVDADTEYFNGREWKKISEYTDGEKVLQYNPGNDMATLIKPIRYIKSPADILWRIHTKRGSINQMLSLDHNFAYVTRTGLMLKKRFSEVIEAHNITKQGFSGRIKTSFSYGDEGMNLTDIELRLMCAVIADGTFDKKLNICRISLKKERKIERLKTILEESQIKYNICFKSNGYTLLSFLAPRREKEFTTEWYKCSQRQLKIITDEVLYWDGNFGAGGRRRFSSTSKKSADFIQFAFSATGRRATIGIDNRVGGIHKSICYEVQISDIDKISLATPVDQEKPKIIKEKTRDGYQYCFEVETGYLVLRRGNRIFVTGNSGKTHLSIAISNKLMEQGVGVRYMQYREVITHLKQNIVDEEFYQREMSKYKNAPVLLMDDLYKGKTTESDINLVYEIINHRYLKGMPIILSCEYSVDKLLDFDEAIGSRIAEMCKGRIVEFIGTELNDRLR